ncbi:sugar kinase [Massilia terrae]|uniref:Sugar kinase n=1 Tax=Massilia terrae TaxID=1811224 RepID=A0ABT2CVY9_9BURK|nr:sugar kinase [Massilia terrae]MCS0657771.1 sugar kinase [Massilia terrae]
MRNPDVVTMGEAMALLIARQAGPLAGVGEFQRATAGAELNVAVGLSRLGYRVAYVSRLGDDSLGHGLRAFMAAQGLDLGYVRTDPSNPTGFMFKAMAGDGADPEIEYFRRGSAASHMTPSDGHDVPVAEARLLHLTGIAPALSAGCRELAFQLAEQARAAGRLVSFDPNLRPRLWRTQADMIDTVNALAGLSDVVMPGLAEGRLLTGYAHAADIAEFYLARGARQVVVKLGPQGAYFANALSSGVAPGHVVSEVIDTVGAGDGFAVGVISALLEGLPLDGAAARGNAIGARVLQFRGDCDGLPDRRELARMPGAILGAMASLLPGGERRPTIH